MPEDSPRGHLRKVYGDSEFARLQAVRAAYDPDNVFRFNIPPG